MSTPMVTDIQARYYEKDHAEAVTIVRQLKAAPAGATAHDVIDLNRFCDCCDDGEGYDVPKERMRHLKTLGLVDGGLGGWYTLTDAGQRVRDQWYDVIANAGAHP